MTLDEYIDDIKLSLGAPIVEVEIEDYIGKLVNKAFREISRYMVDTGYVTVPYARCINTLELNPKIDSVIMVIRTTDPTMTRDLQDAFSLSMYSAGGINSTASTSLLNNIMTRMQVHQLKATMKTDMDFTYDDNENKLYIAAFYPVPSKVTIVYTIKHDNVSEVKEQFWINYIERLALAFTKEALGRVRGKYDLSSSLYKLDGDTLISEGIAERDAIRQELNDNMDIVYPID
jgi:hypothetical protein